MSKHFLSINFNQGNIITQANKYKIKKFCKFVENMGYLIRELSSALNTKKTQITKITTMCQNFSITINII